MYRIQRGTRARNSRRGGQNYSLFTGYYDYLLGVVSPFLKLDRACRGKSLMIDDFYIWVSTRCS